MGRTRRRADPERARIAGPRALIGSPLGIGSLDQGSCQLSYKLPERTGEVPSRVTGGERAPERSGGAQRPLTGSRRGATYYVDPRVRCQAVGLSRERISPRRTHNRRSERWRGVTEPPRWEGT